MTKDQNEDATTCIGGKCTKIADATLAEMLARLKNPEVVRSGATAELRKIAAFGLRHRAARGDLAVQIAEAAATELRRRGTS